jgi:hypothetical protein
MLAPLLVLATSAHADPARRATPPAPEHFFLQHADSVNIHIGDQEGAENRSYEFALALDLASDNTVVATGHGTAADSNLYAGSGARSWETDDTTTWKTVWTGTWTTSRAGLVLSLAAATRDCTSSHRESGRAATPVACPKPAAAKVAFTCTRDQVTLDNGDVQHVKQVDAWRCTAATAADTGEAPSTWLLGIDTCIQVTGIDVGWGGGKAEYHACPPP